MSTAIEQAIAAAQAAAAQVPAQSHQAMTGGAATPPATYSSAPVQPGAPLSFDDLAVGSLDVNGWLKVTEFGLLIGEDKTPFEEISVIIPMDEVAYCRAIRYGDPAKYDRSYDGVTNVRGGSWMDTILRAQKIDPKASEFRSADIPFIIYEELKNKKGEVLAKPEDRLGHSLSVTGWKSFQTFVKGCQRAGMDIKSGMIKCTLTYEVKKNAKGEWGILAFKDAQELNLDAAAE